MFFKSIIMHGFKSFADKVTINFEDDITGIVGPNGCGKSNISDAIRWVLGEQSVKSLRGEKMTDVIFNGSSDRKAHNMAEVTLIFDNSRHLLNSEEDEIEITRRIYNDAETTSEYLINHRPVRLKDIINLITDTGIGKDSLSLISQSNVQSFSDAKPLERRAVFEDAAGVGKYKRSKIESLNRLERTKENLNSTFIMLSELERQVGPLKRQASRARNYKEKKKRLEEIEIAVIVKEIEDLNAKREELNRSLLDVDSLNAINAINVNKVDSEIRESREKLRQYDDQINSLQNQLIDSMNKIQLLERQKIEKDQQRKYLLTGGSQRHNKLEVKAQLDEARFEYEDRHQRYSKTIAEIELISKESEELSYKLVDANLEKEKINTRIRSIENRIDLLNNLLEDPYSSRQLSGVKAISDNKEHLYGVLGIVAEEFTPYKGYEEAVAAAIAGAGYYVIAKDEESAKNAINFLKKNQSGRATFLPINVLKEHWLTEKELVICENSEGFLGTVNEFIDCKDEFRIIADSLLGNNIVVDNLENAIRLNNLLDHNCKIVTLDGDLLNRGGTMSGGKVKNENTVFTAKSQITTLKQDLDSLNAKRELVNKDYSQLKDVYDSNQNKITELKISLASLESILSVKKDKYDKLKIEYDNLPDDEDQENADPEILDQQLISDLNEAYSHKDEVNAALINLRSLRNGLNPEIERNEAVLREARRQLDQEKDKSNRIKTDIALVDNNIRNELDRLVSVYHTTYEYALEHYKNADINETSKDEVRRLRMELDNYGTVNMEAEQQYAEVKERYDFLNHNYQDLIQSRDKILDAIDEMDKIMKKQFTDTFDAINKQLPDTFASLFGGGTAKLVLEDPNDVLNSGIDIDVKPPGKTIRSIRLFSGGEKTLIAISVLFTILKVKELPIVIFDEVEAALDQANVERFAKYVRDYSDKTQFIIITHRPGTMAQCDSLYGVTMQRNGVSELMKVKLVDAIKMSDNNNEG